MAKFREYAPVALGLCCGWGMVSCSEDCEATRSCAPAPGSAGDGNGDGDGGGGGDGDGDGDGDAMGGMGGNTGDGGSNGGNGDGDGDGDGDGNVSPGSGGAGDGDLGEGASGGGDSGIPGPTCTAEEVLCGMACIDPATDLDFCGAMGSCEGEEAGEACDEDSLCEQGRCQLICDDALVVCEGECIDPDTDEEFCGAAGDCGGSPDSGVRCDADELCIDGQCKGWQPAERINAAGSDEPNWLGLQSDQMGNTVLAYVQQIVKDEQELDGLYTSAASNTHGWSSPTEIYTSTSAIILPQLDRSPSGKGLLSSFQYIYSAMYEMDENGQPTGDWIHVHYAGGADSHRGLLLESGARVAAWSGHDGARAAVYETNASFDVDAFEIFNAEGTPVGSLDAAALSDSQAILVWEEGEPGEQALRYAKYSSTGWGRFAGPVVPGDVDAHDPKLVSNRAGGMYLTWSEGGAASQQGLHVARYDAPNERFVDISLDHPGIASAHSIHAFALKNGDVLTFSTVDDSVVVQIYSATDTIWSEQEPPLLLGEGAITGVQMGEDAAGNWVVSYLQKITASSAVAWWTCRFEAVTGTWSEPQEMGVAEPHHRQLTVAPSGEAIVAWTESGQSQPFVRHFR